MKLAIMLYGKRISPRFGYSQGVLIVEVNGQEEVRRRTIGLEGYYPEQIPELLRKAGVEVVISGGMNHYFQNLFKALGIRVIWGIIGDAEETLQAFKADQLAPGMGSCPRSGRKRIRFRGRDQKGGVKNARIR